MGDSNLTEDKLVMPDNLPKDLEGIYRLLGYEDKNNYDDEEYKEEYKEALDLLIDAAGGGSGGGDDEQNIFHIVALGGIQALESAYISCTKLNLKTSYVYDSAFNGLPFLTEASFPNASYIGENVFKSCSNLTAATFPNVTSIGEGAFFECTNLISLYLTGGSLSQVPTIGSITFYNTPIGGFAYPSESQQYGSVYVPASIYSAFLTAAYWSWFSSRIVSVAD